jgi:hypothetical protein
MLIILCNKSFNKKKETGKKEKPIMKAKRQASEYCVQSPVKM